MHFLCAKDFDFNFNINFIISAQAFREFSRMPALHYK